MAGADGRELDMSKGFDIAGVRRLIARLGGSPVLMNSGCLVSSIWCCNRTWTSPNTASTGVSTVSVAAPSKKRYSIALTSYQTT